MITLLVVSSSCGQQPDPPEETAREVEAAATQDGTGPLALASATGESVFGGSGRILITDQCVTYTPLLPPTPTPASPPSAEQTNWSDTESIAADTQVTLAFPPDQTTWDPSAMTVTIAGIDLRSGDTFQFDSAGEDATIVWTQPVDDGCPSSHVVVTAVHRESDG